MFRNLRSDSLSPGALSGWNLIARSQKALLILSGPSPPDTPSMRRACRSLSASSAIRSWESYSCMVM